jgi:hypothetical protein
MRKFLVLLLLATLTSACGGSGGGDGNDQSGDFPFFGGVWEGSVEVARNTCPFTLEDAGLSPVINFRHTVNQVDDTVVLDAEGGGTFIGKVNDDELGFTVVGNPVVSVVDGIRCNASPGIGYFNALGERAGTAFIILLECVGGLECELGWTGTADKR